MSIITCGFYNDKLVTRWKLGEVSLNVYTRCGKRRVWKSSEIKIAQNFRLFSSQYIFFFFQQKGSTYRIYIYSNRFFYPYIYYYWVLAIFKTSSVHKHNVLFYWYSFSAIFSNVIKIPSFNGVFVNRFINFQLLYEHWLQARLSIND